MNATTEEPGAITINNVVSDLQNRGFMYVFKLKGECICCKDYNISFEDFDIAEVHSVSTASQGKHHVLYAITCARYKIKGILVNALENYANSFLNICLNKIYTTKTSG